MSGAPPPAPRAWHAATVEETARAFGVDPRTGLAPAEAARRLAADGPNALPEPEGASWPAQLAAQFGSPLVLLLLAAAVVAALFGGAADTAAIVVVLLVNAVLGVAQERRAAGAIAALRRLAAPRAKVRRGGAVLTIPAASIAAGDVVVVESGDGVPADLRIVEAADLTAAESALTGESETAPKAAAPVAASSPLGDRSSMLFTGTSVATGAGAGIAVATGTATEIGRIAALVRGSPAQETPLQARIRALGRALAAATVVLVGAIAAANLLRGVAPLETMLSSISLAVAAVPEGLPAVVTITLALGVRRMAARRAIVRHLAAVETLGCTSVICTDKTGTLTLGRLRLRALTTLDGAADLRGAAAAETLRAAVAASTVRLPEGVPEDAAAGDPLEAALVVAARDAGIDVAALDRDEPVVALFPFDAVRKRMSVVRTRGPGEPRGAGSGPAGEDASRRDGAVRAYVKGAPESVLPLCVRVVTRDGPVPLDVASRARIDALVENLASRALRVLAVARRDLSGPHVSRDDAVPRGDALRRDDSATRDDAIARADAEAGLDLLGLVGLQDPPRAEAADSVAACRGAGIRVVMITGDHPATALAIARELGVAEGRDEILAGPEIEELTDDALAARLASISVCARTSPEQKLRIVRAWQSRGAVVAMTGDGVNDAPALRAADIGVAMGRGGTDVARDASSMVLTDDDFSTLVAAVEEGRAIFENLRKTLLYLLGGNLAEILVMGAAAILGLPAPLLPIQLLWVNLVTDSLPAIALATDPAEPGLLRLPPRARDARLADGALLAGMIVSSLLVAACLWIAFTAGRATGSIEEARELTFTTLVVARVLLAFAYRSRGRVLWELGLFSNARLVAVGVAALAMQAACHVVPPLGALLATAPLDATALALVAGLALVPVTVIEVSKLVRRAWHARVATG